jgi:spore maturation protein CgeB
VKIVVLGLSVTSSWGNGHATNYRALAAALLERGHELVFLERDQPWYAAARDYEPPWARLYTAVEELDRWSDEIEHADLVLVGSYVPDGCEVAEWVLERAGGVTAFWDIDTPVTVAKLARGDGEYLSPALVPRFDLYLSFTGGPLLERIGARRAIAFHCVVDPQSYRPLDVPQRWQMGYLGTYSADRQPVVDALLVAPARRRPDDRFAVAGPQYPDHVEWPPNVDLLGNLAPGAHAAFYGGQRFALNVTRADMVTAGWSPSVRLFEAAACGTPVISDVWPGLETFFEPGREILPAADADDVERHLRLSDGERTAVGLRARARVLAEHTAAHRAAELEAHVAAVTREVHA